MTGLDMLDVAIGVIFVFLLLSLICSAINEIIEAILKKRGQYLERSIRLLVISVMKGEDNENLKKILEEIYKHPLIDGLFNGKYEFVPAFSEGKKVKFPLSSFLYASKYRKLPCYIPARNFSQAFLDVISELEQPTKDEEGQLTKKGYFSPEKVEKITILKQEVFSNAPTRIETYFKRQIKTLVDELVTDEALNKALSEVIEETAYYDIVQQMKFVINKLPDDAKKASLIKAVDDFNSGVETQFRTFINRVNASHESARKDFEDWYNSGMDRVSGWYKRRTQAISFFFGLAIALLLNVDAITIVQSLTSDKALRAAVVSKAQEYAKTHAEMLKPPAASPSPAQSPPTTAATPTNSNKNNTGAGNSNTATTATNTATSSKADNSNVTVIKAAFFESPNPNTSPTATASPSPSSTALPTASPTGTSSPATSPKPTPNLSACDKNSDSDDCKNQIKQCEQDRTLGGSCKTILACYGKDRSEAGCQDAKAEEAACKKDPKSRQCRFFQCRNDPNALNSPECQLVDSLAEIERLGLPIGWDDKDPRRQYPQNFSDLVFKFFGLFLTAIAISLGAPFWFDLLNKFMVVRSTVKPTEKSPDEASEDRQTTPGKK
jgi:hypothetical protein